ncbi:MAG: carbonic anhydrase [Muribaculaceae bacterium]|nr:carbonic anhydrase [Muribaculaceae bacterium]
MQIKKIIRSQKLRHRLMKLGGFLPDSVMLPLQYRLLLGRWPHLKNPTRFTEYIQLYKMYYHNPVLLECVDKYTVRDYVARHLGDEYLVKLYQVCESAEEIDFYKLPERFVIKSTSGGNGDNVIVVKNKSELDIPATIAAVNGWRSKDYSSTSREWAYTAAARHPRIIVEEYLENTATSLDDYKFFCFGGKMRYLSVDKDRYADHTRAFYDRELNFLPDVAGKAYKVVEKAPELPANIDEMVRVAESLAAEFPFVRVDLYNVDGKIYFGELTFYPASGYSRYEPDSFDAEMGAYFPKAGDPIWKYKK